MNMGFGEGFKELFLRIGLDLNSPAGFLSLGALTIFILIVWKVNQMGK